MPLGQALVILAKIPLPGRVKTRLCPPLRPDDAARLYACMLEDAASEMASLPRVRRYLFLAPPGEIDTLDARPFADFDRRPQRGKDLGDRMAHAARAAFRDGARSVTIIGADCPTLSAGKVGKAFRELDAGAGAVFCPSTDGGFCLAALAAPGPRIFRGIAWSAPTVLSAVATRCRALGTPFALLPPERDVDVYDDLLALRAWAGAHRRPSCPRTRAWISAAFASRGGAKVSR
jgi:uncharacterized protein